MNFEEILKSENTTIVDVRTSEEFRGGNVNGSINIPVNEIPNRLEEFKQMKKPIVLCCASGGRSGQAHMYLAQQGIQETYNAGSWLDVNHYKNA